jgi:D-cysteine desulfhydrase
MPDASPSLEDALARYPRVTLTRLPTPLHRLDTLSDELRLNIYMKRDDLTDLTFGGDKPRKLEYELAAATAAGADTLVTTGSAQSNHARLTTAAARRLGLRPVVVLSDDEWRDFQGNLLTVHLMGARVEIIDAEDHWDLEEHALRICDELTAEGRHPHYIPVSGTTPLSCLGYVQAGLEIADQLAEMGLRPDAVYSPFGTGGIFTSVLFALRHRGINAEMIGVSVNRPVEMCRSHITEWWTSNSDLLGIAPSPEMGVHEVTDAFIGAGYGDPTPAALDAIVDMAQAEGILLDPVYSGKMAAGFFAHAAEGRWDPGSTILLIHSGGSPALFAYRDPLQAHLEGRGILPPGD